MKNRLTYGLLIVAGVMSGIAPAWGEQVLGESASPNDSIKLVVLDDNDALYYKVVKGTATLVEKSALGIVTSVGDFSSGVGDLAFTDRLVNDPYELPSGKCSRYENSYREATVTGTKDGHEVEFVFRVYDDGVAYRYEFPGSGEVSVYAEQSECLPAACETLYSQQYTKDSQSLFSETATEFVACATYTPFPVLVEMGGNYLLMTEARVNGSYCGSTLTVNDETGAFCFQPRESVSTTLPLATPWRVLLVGSLESVVETVMLENLNDATAVNSLSWITPGRAAWNIAGEDFTADYLNMSNIKHYIDWAQEQGWEYFTLDKCWEQNDISLREVVDYASSKKVGVLIWVNQNDLPSDESALNAMVQSWKSQGVKGLKVDFWESESQATMQKVDLLLRVTAQNQLLLDLYACPKPTGLRRTWPHLLTSEAVLPNTVFTDFPDIHNINSAIIRGAIGSTDYAPVDFADRNGCIHSGTTWAHQLALSVVFESGIQHLADAPENFEYHMAREFLKRLPVAWDNTRCLEARPDEYVSLVRQKGDEWYWATLTHEARTARVPLSFLPEGESYCAYVYGDGDCPSEVRFEYRDNLSARDTLSVDLLKRGGAVVLFSTSSQLPRPIQMKYEAEAGENTIPFGVPVKSDVDSLCSGGEYVASIGNGRALVFNGVTVPESGTYAMTLYYMSDAPCSAYVKLNGDINSWQEISFENTGGSTGRYMAHRTVLVTLDHTVSNTIEVGNNSDYGPNLDRIVLSKYADGTTDVEAPQESESVGLVYVLDRDIIIEQASATDYAVYNSLGQLLRTGHFEGGRLSVSVPDRGVYFVKLHTAGLDFTQKVLIGR